METPQGQWYTLDELIERLLESMRAQSTPARLALTISGGGAAGCYQAGVLQTLVARLHQRARELGHPQLVPQIVVGTSTGALNAYSLFVESLRLTYPAPTAAGSFAAEVWKAIDAGHDGSRYVTGLGNLLVKLATRPRLRLCFGGAAALLLAWVVKQVWPYPEVQAKLLAALVFTGPVAAWAFFRRSLLQNRSLSATLTHALVPTHPPRKPNLARWLERPFNRKAMTEASERLVTSWHEALKSKELGPDQPRAIDFILTATDLTTKRETLFTLVRPETFERLVHHEWFAFQVSEQMPDVAPELAGRPYGRVAPGELLRCVVASTNIPAVFPTMDLELFRGRDGQGVRHDFVDGGVLNNVPMHVAIDAGATHVLSVELNDLVEEGPLLLPEERPKPGDWPANKPWPPKYQAPNLFENLGGTFTTLLDFATREEIRHASEWNRRLNPGRGLGQVRYDDPAAGQVTDKRTVLLFRVAPEGAQKVTLVEFDGHFGDRLFTPQVSLTQWLLEGARDAASKPLFWDATLGAAPSAHPDAARASARASGHS